MHPLDMQGNWCYSGCSSRIEVRRYPGSFQRSKMRLDHSRHRTGNGAPTIMQQLISRQRQYRVSRTLWQVNA